MCREVVVLGFDESQQDGHQFVGRGFDAGDGEQSAHLDAFLCDVQTEFGDERLSSISSNTGENVEHGIRKSWFRSKLWEERSQQGKVVRENLQVINYLGKRSEVAGVTLFERDGDSLGEKTNNISFGGFQLLFLNSYSGDFGQGSRRVVLCNLEFLDGVEDVLDHSFLCVQGVCSAKCDVEGSFGGHVHVESGFVTCLLLSLSVSSLGFSSWGHINHVYVLINISSINVSVRMDLGGSFSSQKNHVRMNIGITEINNIRLIKGILEYQKVG